MDARLGWALAAARGVLHAWAMRCGALLRLRLDGRDHPKLWAALHLLSLACS